MGVRQASKHELAAALHRHLQMEMERLWPLRVRQHGGRSPVPCRITGRNGTPSLPVSTIQS